MENRLTGATGAAPNRTRRTVLYMAAPLRPTEAEIAAYGGDARLALLANLARAEAWLAWLRRASPAVTFIAPWIASVRSGEDDSDPAQREAGLVDDCTVIERCDGVVLAGGRVSSGMRRERKAAYDSGIEVTDLTALGVEPPRELFGWPVPSILLGGAR